MAFDFNAPCIDRFTYLLTYSQVVDVLWDTVYKPRDFDWTTIVAVELSSAACPCFKTAQYSQNNRHIYCENEKNRLQSVFRKAQRSGFLPTSLKAWMSWGRSNMKLCFVLLGITPIMSFITSYPHQKHRPQSPPSHTQLYSPYSCNEAELSW